MEQKKQSKRGTGGPTMARLIDADKINYHEHTECMGTEILKRLEPLPIRKSQKFQPWMPWKWCVVGSASTDTEFPDNQTLFVRKCTAMISAPMENERKVTGMSEYHVGCGSFGIYAGTLNSRNKNIWKNKSYR